ncbi:MAG: sigma factor, partial [Burkholderiaceae bacterium]
MSESLQKQEAELHAAWMQSLQGDQASYQRALGLMSGHVRRFLQKRMQSQLSDVEDLVQETLMAIHQKRHTYQSDQPLTAWMYAIAR